MPTTKNPSLIISGSPHSLKKIGSGITKFWKSAAHGSTGSISGHVNSTSPSGNITIKQVFSNCVQPSYSYLYSNITSSSIQKLPSALKRSGISEVIPEQPTVAGGGKLPRISRSSSSQTVIGSGRGQMISATFSIVTNCVQEVGAKHPADIKV